MPAARSRSTRWRWRGGKYDKWVNQNGGAILDDYVNPSKCMLADPKSIAAVKFFADMMNNGYAMRDADLSQAGGDAAVFQSGQAAMIIQNTSRVSGFNKANMNYDVAVVPIPKGGKRWNPAGGAAWVMSAKSDNKDAAWTFLQWLQSTNGGEKLYTERGEIFPALQSMANSPVFMTDQPPANKQGDHHRGKAPPASAASATSRSGMSWTARSSTRRCDRIWAGEANAEQALPDAVQAGRPVPEGQGIPEEVMR